MAAWRRPAEAADRRSRRPARNNKPVAQPAAASEVIVLASGVAAKGEPVKVRWAKIGDPVDAGRTLLRAALDVVDRLPADGVPLPVLAGSAVGDTHALDRDALTTDKKDYGRFDLQLVAMIDDARARQPATKSST